MDTIFFLLGKIFALIVGVRYFKYLLLPYRLVFLLIAIAFVCESYGYYLGKYAHQSNVWLFNLYMIAEVWLLGLAAIFLIGDNRSKKIILLILGLNTVIWIVTISVNSIYTFANIAMVAGCGFVTLIYLYVLFASSLFSNKRTLSQPIFWLILSTILYFACDIPYMGLHNYMVRDMPRVSKQLGYINTTLDIIRYPLVAISFILLGRQGKPGAVAN